MEIMILGEPDICGSGQDKAKGMSKEKVSKPEVGDAVAGTTVGRVLRSLSSFGHRQTFSFFPLFNQYIFTE